MTCIAGELLAWYPKYKQWKRVKNLLEQGAPADERKFGLWPVVKVLGEAGIFIFFSNFISNPEALYNLTNNFLDVEILTAIINTFQVIWQQLRRNWRRF